MIGTRAANARFISRWVHLNAADCAEKRAIFGADLSATGYWRGNNQYWHSRSECPLPFVLALRNVANGAAIRKSCGADRWTAGLWRAAINNWCEIDSQRPFENERTMGPARVECIWGLTKQHLAVQADQGQRGYCCLARRSQSAGMGRFSNLGPLISITGASPCQSTQGVGYPRHSPLRGTVRSRCRTSAYVSRNSCRPCSRATLHSPRP